MADITAAANQPHRSARGGVVVRAFWWGFHIEIDHGSLQAALDAADVVNTLVGLIGDQFPVRRPRSSHSPRVSLRYLFRSFEALTTAMAYMQHELVCPRSLRPHNGSH